MKKRGMMLILCALLLFQLAMPSAAAAKQVCFVATGENILTLTDDTMPFWYNGYLYVSSSIFTGVARDSLNISRVYNKTMSQVVLYSEGNALLFDMNMRYAQDVEGNIYRPGGVRRNGNLYVPASVVAEFFGLQYSFIEVPRGHLVWLRRPDSLQIQDTLFADAASFAMEEKYSEYIKAQEATAPQEPDVEEPVVVPEITGKVMYLCIRAGEDTKVLLDVLDRYDAQAAFFCDLEFLETEGGLLRRMTATGQAIGLLVDAADPERTVEEQLELGNQILERATCGRTRLVQVENGREQDVEAAKAAGYRCLDADLDRSGYSLRTQTHAENLRQRLTNRRSGVVVWLGDTVGGTGLRAFLGAATEAEDRCLAWTETA